MASPEEPEEIFIREVDEEVRRDRLKQIWRLYGRWIVLAVVAGLAILAAGLYWLGDEAKKAGDTGEKFVQALGKIETGDVAGANPALDALAAGGQPGYQALALLTKAANATQAGDTETALKHYRQVVADSSLAVPFRDLALIRQTRLEFDTLKPEAIVARLQSLSVPGNAWFGVAGEMTAIAQMRAGKPALAEPLFTAIANDATLEQSLRSRAAQMATALAANAGRAPALKNGSAPVAPTPSDLSGPSASPSENKAQ